MKTPSTAVKGAALAGIASLEPSKVAEYSNQVDLTNVSDDIMNVLLPVIVKNKLDKHMPAIASVAAFYPFVKFQNPTLGAAAEEGYQWIMSSDNTKATEKLIKIMGQVKGELESNPQAKMMMLQVLKDGLNRKMQVLKANPTNPLVKKQIDSLNKTIESYTK